MQRPEESAARQPLHWSGNVRRILVVEDDVDQTVLLKDFLESYFYRVTAVANGADALKEILAADFDVILCDMVMPQMPGDMFYHAVHRVKPHLCDRFIFITAHGENARIQEFLNRTTEMVLIKPFHLDDLLELILLLFRELENPRNKLGQPAPASSIAATRPAGTLRVGPGI